MICDVSSNSPSHNYILLSKQKLHTSKLILQALRFFSNQLNIFLHTLYI